MYYVVCQNGTPMTVKRNYRAALGVMHKLMKTFNKDIKFCGCEHEVIGPKLGQTNEFTLMDDTEENIIDFSITCLKGI